MQPDFRVDAMLNDVALPTGAGGPLRVRTVAEAREVRRQARLRRIALFGLLVNAYLWYRVAQGLPLPRPQLPYVDPLYLMTGIFFGVMLVVLLGTSWFAGRSPHLTFRPEQLDVTLDDVKGLGPVTDEVRRTIDLFLAGRTFRHEMGGRPRRGLLFEGPPGTGKTYMAKAMAAEAGVPFLFVSATSFQSMYYGATARKIRSYFNALRKAARAEGGAIAFIEEIDAIATTRGGMGGPAFASTPTTLACGGLEGLSAGTTSAASRPVVQNAVSTEGVGGVVNELLVQMQSFDTPTLGERLRGWAVETVNTVLPANRRIPKPRPVSPDVLVIAATNRAEALDPALLRPGRFDRRLGFELPDKAARRELIDFFLERKAHERVLDDVEHRDALAGVTQGYSPVMIEHLLDEALVNAVRRQARGMSWADVEQARLVVEVGLGHPVGYTAHEERLIATHEAGHAVTAWLVAPQRRLEILTIVKRAGSLGLLAHGDREDVYTRSRSELEGMIQIAFGGQVAEELFFGDVSTGPASDLAYATGVAAQMVGSAGMDDSLVSFAAGSAGALGGDIVSRVLGDQDARAQVEALLGRQKAQVRTLLATNRHLVEALRDALLERHELIGREIERVLLDAGGRPDAAADSASA
ncbi:AAA family ATPase [Spongisporangium articulatum]|uniref:AAA family ATPase n=1 Tax=Spongisporangium articulatum TaxID=3362603 RepID=A0ABW8AQ95_9ACTN